MFENTQSISVPAGVVEFSAPCMELKFFSWRIFLIVVPVDFRQMLKSLTI